VAADRVAATRPEWPFRELRPTAYPRYSAFLADWVAVGPQALVVRDLAARQFRAFSPGLLVWALGLAGLVLGRNGRLRAAGWLGAGVLLAVASTGPFLAVQPRIAAPTPVNPAWLAVRYAFPGGGLILEPLRYAFPALLALSVAASLGALVVVRRFGSAVGFVPPVLVVLEVALLSPIPVPLPTARPEASEAARRLDEVLPPGAVVHLPLFDRGTQRFDRSHLVDQRVHRRPVPDEVMGLPPAIFMENQFLAVLVEAEQPRGDMAVHPEDPGRFRDDRDRLVEAGFSGIVVDPARYAMPGRAERVLALLASGGHPVTLGDRVVVRLGPQGDLAKPRPAR